MGGFLSAIFGGSNPALSKDTNEFGSLAGFNTGQGEGDVNAASQYYQNILSGNPTQIDQSLAPEISAGQTQAQQAKNNSAEFGTRSGGTASANAGIDSATRGNLINLIGGLQSGAASGAGSLGSNQLSQASSNLNSQANASQMQLGDWLNSILGKGIAAPIGDLESYGVGSLEGIL